MTKRFFYAMLGAIVMAAIGIAARQVSVMLWRGMTHQDPPIRSI